jgi:hypothetical protein
MAVKDCDTWFAMLKILPWLPLDLGYFPLTPKRRGSYRSGSYYQDTKSIHPGKLDSGIHAADGLFNNFLIDK